MTVNEWIERIRIQGISGVSDEKYQKALLDYYQSLIPVSAEELVRLYEASEASVVSPKEAHEQLQAAMGVKGMAKDGSGQDRVTPRP